MKNKPIHIIICLAVLCYAWIMLALRSEALLYEVHNFSPWMSTTSFFGQCIWHPGGMREWIGYALTQLMALPWLGATVMVMLWGLSAWCLTRALQLTRWTTLLSLIPAVALLASITQLGYWMFCLKAPSYWFGPTVGLTIMSAGILGYTTIQRKTTQDRRLFFSAIFLLLWTWGSEAVLGWYATLGLLVMLISSRTGWKQWMLLAASSAIGLILFALCFYQGTDLHWREPLLWYGFHHIVIPEAESKLLETPFWVLAGSIILAALIGRCQKLTFCSILSPILLSIVLYGGLMLNYRNVNFHTELRMLRQLEEGQWEQILSEMRHLDGHRPTRQMVMMKDVALAQTGRLGDEAFTYDFRGTRPQMNIDLPIHMNHSAGPYFYYWLGLPNYAFVWCMEDNIEYGLSPYFLKLMYRCTLANGESEASRKYRSLLDGLWFTNIPKAETPEGVKRLMTGHDQLTNDRGYSEIYLMDRLSQEQYNDAVSQQVAVHYAMLMRNKERFAQALRHYLQLQYRDDTLGHAEAPLPLHFQEAALLFETDSVCISPEQSQRYTAFCQQIHHLQRNGLQREAIGQQMYSQWGKTYWWYYDFYTDNRSY